MALTKPSSGDPGYSGGTKASVVIGGIVDAIGQMAVNVKSHYGATGDGTTDDTTAVQNALTAVATGGLVYFPPGTYVISSALTLTASSGVTLTGQSLTRSVNAAPPSVLKFTMTGAGDGITAKGATGLRIAHMALMYTSSSFTGNLVNLTTNAGTRTTQFVAEDIWAGGSGVSTANSLFKIDGAIGTRFNGLVAFKADHAIESDGGNSSQCLIEQPTSTLLDVSFLHNAPNTTTIISPVGEPLSSGAAGFILTDSGTTVLNSMVIINPWWGDISASSGAWVSADEVRSLTVLGGYIGYGSTTTVFKCTSSATARPWRGVRIGPSIQFVDDSSPTGVLFDPGTSTSAHDIEFEGNQYWSGTNIAARETVPVSNGTNFTCTPATRSVMVANTGGASTITLPDATKYYRHVIKVTRAGTGAGAITIGASAGNVNGGATATLGGAAGATMILESNATDWWGG